MSDVVQALTSTVEKITKQNAESIEKILKDRKPVESAASYKPRKLEPSLINGTNIITVVDEEKAWDDYSSQRGIERNDKVKWYDLKALVVAKSPAKSTLDMVETQLGLDKHEGGDYGLGVRKFWGQMRVSVNWSEHRYNESLKSAVIDITYVDQSDEHPHQKVQSYIRKYRTAFAKAVAKRAIEFQIDSPSSLNFSERDRVISLFVSEEKLHDAVTDKMVEDKDTVSQTLDKASEWSRTQEKKLRALSQNPTIPASAPSETALLIQEMTKKIELQEQQFEDLVCKISDKEGRGWSSPKPKSPCPRHHIKKNCGSKENSCVFDHSPSRLEEAKQMYTKMQKMDCTDMRKKGRGAKECPGPEKCCYGHFKKD